MSNQYPEQINLPFNRCALPSDFELLKTPGSVSSEEGYWIILKNGNILIETGEQIPLIPYGTMQKYEIECVAPLHFANMKGRPVRAIHLSKHQNAPSGLQAESFNAFNDSMTPELLSISGLGKQLLFWDETSRFCPRCGGNMQQMTETWGKQCHTCKLEQFPRIHPCAIVVVKKGDQLLLIRKPEWAKGRYSLVAGFIDPGESLEECAAREVLEETGIEIRNIRYVTSQAWPFPSQLMAGFVADYAYGDINISDPEIEDARWFTVGSLPSLPAKRSIARQLIDIFNK